MVCRATQADSRSRFDGRLHTSRYDQIGFGPAPVVRRGPECRGNLMYDRQLGIAKGGWCNIAWSRLLMSHGFLLGCPGGGWPCAIRALGPPTTSTLRLVLVFAQAKRSLGWVSTSPRRRVLRFNRLEMGWFSVLHRVRPERVPSSERRGGWTLMGRIRRHVSMGCALVSAKHSLRE